MVPGVEAVLVAASVLAGVERDIILPGGPINRPNKEENKAICFFFNPVCRRSWRGDTPTLVIGAYQVLIASGVTAVSQT
jgi:hypothetical protein